VAAYSGVATTGGIADIASSADTAATQQHASPSITAPDGAWVVQLWADKSTSTAAWTPPSGVTSRGTSFGTGSGHTSALLADSGAPVAAGTYGGGVASTDASSAKGVAWTIALKSS
ncbi:MAG: hypothetical protein ABIR34_08830, partial [Marmoricola sp.]